MTWARPDEGTCFPHAEAAEPRGRERKWNCKSSRELDKKVDYEMDMYMLFTPESEQVMNGIKRRIGSNAMVIFVVCRIVDGYY